MKGQAQCLVLVRQDGPETANHAVRQPERRPTPAGPDGIEQVHELLPAHRGGQRDLGGVEVRERWRGCPGRA